jgi:hypothetical protein
MAVMILTCEVEDPTQWEERFRTHTDLFRSMTISKPMRFAVDGNHVAMYTEADDLDTYMKVFQSEATAAAMKEDGVKRDTVRFWVLDKSLDL